MFKKIVSSIESKEFKFLFDKGFNITQKQEGGMGCASIEMSCEGAPFKIYFGSEKDVRYISFTLTDARFQGGKDGTWDAFYILCYLNPELSYNEVTEAFYSNFSDELREINYDTFANFTEQNWGQIEQMFCTEQVAQTVQKLKEIRRKYNKIR